MNTKRVCKYKSSFDVYIGRGSIWGNPYSHKSGTKAEFIVDSREDAVNEYEKYLLNSNELWKELGTLKGKTLGCYCHENQLCHGDILSKYANMLGNRGWWGRKKDNGYEVSSVGDKRFSAFYAKLPDGKTIEYHYQVTIKGYKSIKEGKGKPFINPEIKDYDELYKYYKKLWEIHFNTNYDEWLDLARKSIGKTITDCFANSDINQARAITELLNENLL